LGTNGYGRSDTREELRKHFEIDMPSVVATALYGLSLDGAIKGEQVKEAMDALGVDDERRDPLHA
jgi:pyruvate dehydrogenase E1 component